MYRQSGKGVRAFEEDYLQHDVRCRYPGRTGSVQNRNRVGKRGTGEKMNELEKAIETIRRLESELAEAKEAV